MTDVLTDRMDIDSAIAGRGIARAFADTVAARGDGPAYADKVGVQDQAGARSPGPRCARPRSTSLQRWSTSACGPATGWR
jgi:hypothetical protein